MKRSTNSSSRRRSLDRPICPHFVPGILFTPVKCDACWEEEEKGVTMGGNVSIEGRSYVLGDIAIRVHGDLHRQVRTGDTFELCMRCSLADPHTPVDERAAHSYLRGARFREEVKELLHHEPGERIASELRLGISDALCDRVHWMLKRASPVIVDDVGKSSWEREVTFTMESTILPAGPDDAEKPVMMFQVAALFGGSLAWSMRVGTLPNYHGCGFAIHASRLGVRLSSSTQAASSSHSSICSRQTGARYTRRPGPPFPANECRHLKRVGNDGKGYVSTPDKGGVHRWVAFGAASTRR